MSGNEIKKELVDLLKLTKKEEATAKGIWSKAGVDLEELAFQEGKLEMLSLIMGRLESILGK